MALASSTKENKIKNKLSVHSNWSREYYQ